MSASESSTTSWRNPAGDAAALATAWAFEVNKIDQDRALPWEDHSVWNEHDLAGALFLDLSRH